MAGVIPVSPELLPGSRVLAGVIPLTPGLMPGSRTLAGVIPYSGCILVWAETHVNTGRTYKLQTERAQRRGEVVSRPCPPVLTPHHSDGVSTFTFLIKDAFSQSD